MLERMIPDLLIYVLLHLFARRMGAGGGGNAVLGLRMGAGGGGNTVLGLRREECSYDIRIQQLSYRKEQVR